MKSNLEGDFSVESDNIKVQGTICESESDSDLFGDGEITYMIDQTYEEPLLKSQSEPLTLESEQTDKVKFLSDNNFTTFTNNENTGKTTKKFLNLCLKSPKRYADFLNENRIFATLKLPQRLQIGSTVNIRGNEGEKHCINGCTGEDGNMDFNSTLVRWSDNTYSLYIGGTFAYDCIVGNEKALLFDDSTDSTYKLGLSEIKHKLTLRPRNIEKIIHIKDPRNRVMMSTTIEEAREAEMEFIRKSEELKVLTAMKIQQKSVTNSRNTRRNPMTKSFLEDSSEEESN
ncbi:hypothetical protein cand_020290 [Cryptosporidium andersoni]|uniref:Uncharacterized protein n=1 Tax=Cryptosporidium andersoni TaxID=117008 RepID=A0A1J4MTC6_9CRYT|nr:hypothetical protein cand_020290 [Cryptosporidium andersoni]